MSQQLDAEQYYYPEPELHTLDRVCREEECSTCKQNIQILILRELVDLNSTLRPFAERFSKKLPVGAWLKGS